VAHGFASAFVFIEPSPYEIVGALAIAIFALTGLKLRAPLVPLILLLVFLNLGYATAMLQVVDQSKVVTWVLVSAYLALTAVVYAAMLGANTQARLDWLMRGCLAAGWSRRSLPSWPISICSVSCPTCFCSMVARAAPSTIERAWRVPVLPALMTFQRMLTGRLSSALNAAILLLVMLRRCFSRSRARPGPVRLRAMLLMGSPSRPAAHP